MFPVQIRLLWVTDGNFALNFKKKILFNYLRPRGLISHGGGKTWVLMSPRTQGGSIWVNPSSVCSPPPPPPPTDHTLQCALQ